MQPVIEIVMQFLKSNGFDGLVHPGKDCGCELIDLQPCGENFAECYPAYKLKDADGDLIMHSLMTKKKYAKKNMCKY